MDPQQQALIAALMGGQNSALPSQIAPQPDPALFTPQAAGYGQRMSGQDAGMQPNQGMFSLPYGAVASQQMYPQNRMS